MKRFFVFFIILTMFIFSFFSIGYYDDFLSRLNSLNLVSSYDNNFICYDNIDELMSRLNLNVVSERVISDRVIIEGYSSLINDYVVVNNHKVNVQMCLLEDKILVGVPLIKGSFWFYV